MKYFISALFFFILFTSAYLNAQEQTKTQEEQMKAWQDYMTPGEYHKMLQDLAGNWTFKMKMWSDPSAKPENYEGTATYEMILGGRYLQSIQKGVMNGMPFEGRMLQGYDNLTKEFTSVWIDNFGTGILVSKGTYDPATKSITVIGSSVDPMSGKRYTMKEVDKEIDHNNRHMDYYIISNDKEYKSMEMDYTRK